MISPFAEEPPVSPLLSEENQEMNCNPEYVNILLLFKSNIDCICVLFSFFFIRVMRCSLNVIPQTKELLNKSRLPLGILIHPFKDLEVNTYMMK